MTPITKFFAFLLVISCVITSACSKDDPVTNNCAANFNYAVELQAEAAAFSTAAGNYSQDGTTENCNALKAAYQAYLDAAEDVRPCVVAAELAGYQAAIDEARNNLDDITC